MLQNRLITIHLGRLLNSKNEVFANSSEIELFLEMRKEHNNSMMEVKMDKTFHLTQQNKENTQYVIDMNNKLLQKIMFRANHEAVTLAKIISMPNKVVVTWSNSYIVRIWTLLGFNLCLLNLEYPLPYKWNLMINRFHQRKQKYIEARKILQELEKRWFRRNSLDGDITPKSPFIKKDPLEKDKSIVTFKSLISEMKDNSSSCLTLRKIDAIKRINLEQISKSPLDIQLEMLESKIAESENK